MNALPWFRFLIPPLVLGAWGCLMLHLSTSGVLLVLQHPRFHILTLAGGILFVLLSLAYPYLFEPRDNPIRQPFSHTIALGLLLLLPLGFQLFYPVDRYSPDRLLSRASGSFGLIALRPFDAPPELPWLKQADGPVPEVAMLDLLIAAEYPELRAKLEGRRVRILGQWLPDENGEGRSKLVRMMMFCCAADARPIGLWIAPFTPPPPAQAAWIEVEGTLHMGEQAELLDPVLTPAEAPKDLFVY